MHSGIGDFVDVRVRWHDATPHGSLLSDRLQETIRHRLYPETWARLSREMAKPGADRARFDAAELCRMVREERSTAGHRQVIGDPAFWRPDPGSVRIEGFEVSSEECGCAASLSLAATDCDAMRTWLRNGGSPNPALIGLGRAIAASIEAASFRRTALPRGSGDPLVTGHACVSWSDGDVRLWTDPFIRPKRLRYPAGQQPLSPLDAPEPKHVVLITHCHPDHFDPASLLLFPSDTTIVVPHVAHESPLAFDMALRARQLGFADVRALAWDDRVEIGRFAITACPFYGEQPLGAYAAAGERRDRNQGSTYHVAGPSGLTALFLADAGADPDGSSLALARQVRASLGRVDLLFGNHRRWRVFPPQFITTSVPQNLCYVPDEELGVPQLMMLTPEQLIEIGEVLSSRHVIPYAMGNAPWFAEIGLGPDDHAASPPGAFDAPLAAAAASDPDTLVTPAARIAILTPGDQIGVGGPTRDAGFVPIDAAAFGAASGDPTTPYRSLALGGVHEAGIVRDLIALTRVDPASYLVAAPEFVEIATTDPDAGAFLFELAGRLVPQPAWISRSDRPLVAGLFGAEPTWLARFEACHHEASRALRDAGPAGLAAIRPVIAQLRSATSSAAIAAVAADLLDLDLSLAPSVSVAATMGDPDIALPRMAAGPVAIHGRAAVTAALLIVKLLHNVVLTMRALDHAESADEADLFAWLLDG